MEKRISIVEIKVFAHEDGKISIDFIKNKELSNEDVVIILEKIIDEINTREVN